MKLPADLRQLLQTTPELSRAYLVGGCVRDAWLGRPQTDFDLEVYGVDYETLVNGLRRHGRADLVGKSFGVIKFTRPDGAQWDFSLPRRDSKTAAGHKGFAIEFDPNLEPREAASRRDFTINALMFNPRTNEYLDFFGGRQDLADRILRHTSDRFADDPLRVLRGMQFVARFQLTPAPDTVALCRSISHTFTELAPERVGLEWLKWAGASREPAAGLRFLQVTNWLQHFPELAALVNTPQDPEWHPEGDVFTHTGHCCDALAELPDWQAADETTRRVLMVAVLAHDFGKPATTHRAERHGRMRIVSPGHEQQGGPLTETFLARLKVSQELTSRIVPLVTHHLAQLQTVTARSVRRLANALKPATIDDLCLVMLADSFGRPPKPRIVPPGILALKEKAAALRLQAAAPKPLLQGRHLIARGWRPDREFGVTLKAAFEAQLDGAFNDLAGALRWLDARTPEG
ncbi:MAG: HD domain-containing protein [Verrucomicrobiae bacterium]|nr:HD domain-containing protein [Verrucomicrobiae bacterium]